jgi:hypothetical protein
MPEPGIEDAFISKSSSDTICFFLFMIALTPIVIPTQQIKNRLGLEHFISDITPSSRTTYQALCYEKDNTFPISFFQVRHINS